VDITPETKVAALLDAYPALEELLISLAPAFARLRNPVLRKTVARVTTLALAASIAGISAREMVTTLRREAGLSSGETGPAAACHESEGPADGVEPEWFDEDRIRDTIDADAMLESGQVPLASIMGRAAALRAREIVCVSSGFPPAPLVETLRAKGYETWVRRVGDARFETFVRGRGR
jgi:hypothetical protein